jgi:membrane protease YdiL (CAAX protease family)
LELKSDTPELLEAEPVPRWKLSGLASWVTFAGFVSFATVGGAAQLLNVSFGLWWCEVFLFFGIPYVVLRISGRNPLMTTGLRTPWVAGAGFGVALGVTNFFAVVAPIQFAAQKLARHVLSDKWVDAYDSAKVFHDKTSIELLAIILGVTLAAPVAEEFFFRGVLQRGWSTSLGPVTGIIFTSAVFSAFHLDPLGFFARWELGVLFGLLAYRTGSLWPGIFAHFANNATSTLLYFSFKDSPTDTSGEFSALAVVAGLGGVLLLATLVAAIQFPQSLEAPERSVETVEPPASPALAGRFLLASVLAVVGLLLVDFRGSLVNAIDIAVPHRSLSEELKEKRSAAKRGDISVFEYLERRKKAPNEVADAGVITL